MLAALDEAETHKKPVPTDDFTARYGDPIENVDLSEAPEDLHKQIRDMLKTHTRMWDGTLGSIRATEHAIVTEPGTLPIRSQPYRTGPHKRQVITDQINKMLKLNVIEPSHSAWARPVVIVPKKNGKARFCVDYRRLNNVTKTDAYPLPRMEDCLDSLGDAKVFTSLNCTAGYWQVPLRKEDREKTAFTTRAGIYHWLSMPFGLTNAPATFQRALDIILSGLKWQICLVYLDDVIIFSANAEQHIKDVDTVLTRLHEAGVTLNLEKCTWISDEVEYLGHIVRPGTLHVHNKNVDALRQASFPRTKTQLKSFLGMCNVYRRFVKDFAKRAKPLNALTRAEVHPMLPPPTAEQLASFEDLRQALLDPPVLALPKANHRMVLDVDACADQLGATLLEEEEDGQLLPVGYWSRGLSPAERNYSTTERECLGVVWSVLKLRHFLDGQRFLVRTDHQALSWIYSTTDSSGQLMRRRLRLAEYTFDTQYKPGASHHLPDFLSRTDNDAPMEPIQDDIPCLALTGTANGLETGRYTGGEVPKAIEFDEIIEAQQADEWCVDMLKRVDSGAVKVFFQDEHHALYCRSQHGDQLVIPAALRDRLLWWEHTATVAAHPGINRMYYTMRRKYYWPSMVTDIFNVITKCTTCAQNRLALRRHTSPLTLFPPTEPLTDLSVDIFGPIPASKSGNRFILVITDRFSKLTKCVALRKITAMSVASAIIDAWVSCYGPSDRLLSDQGPQFMSNFFVAVMKMLGIETVRTTAYHPQTNGQVERYNRTMATQLRHYVADDPSRWDELLPIITLAYNSQPHRSTGIAPLELVIPRRVPNLMVRSLPPGTPLKNKGALDNGSPLARKRQFMASLRRQIPAVAEALRKTQQRYKKNFDANAGKRNDKVKIGDSVYTTNHSRDSKLQSRAIGPYIVVDADEATYVIDVDGEEKRVSSDHATPAPRPSTADANPHPLLDGLDKPKDITPVVDEYVVDKLLGVKKIDGQFLAKVRWFDYGSKDDSWEPLENLPRNIVVRYLRQKKLSVPGYGWQPKSPKGARRSRRATSSAPTPEAARRSSRLSPTPAPEAARRSSRLSSTPAAEAPRRSSRLSPTAPTPETTVSLVQETPEWIPKIIHVYTNHHGVILAVLNWTRDGQAFLVKETVPLNRMKLTLPDYARNLRHDPLWGLYHMAQLDKEYGPYTAVWPAPRVGLPMAPTDGRPRAPNSYLCPPTEDLEDAVRDIKDNDHEVTLVAPAWTHAE